MKLKFTKNEKDNEIEVLIDDKGTEKQFDYVDFIKSIYFSKKKVETNFDKNLTDDEKTKINGMLTEINKIVSKNESSE